MDWDFWKELLTDMERKNSYILSPLLPLPKTDYKHLKTVKKNNNLEQILCNIYQDIVYLRFSQSALRIVGILFHVQIGAYNVK